MTRGAKMPTYIRDKNKRLICILQGGTNTLPSSSTVFPLTLLLMQYIRHQNLTTPLTKIVISIKSTIYQNKMNNTSIVYNVL